MDTNPEAVEVKLRRGVLSIWVSGACGVMISSWVPEEVGWKRLIISPAIGWSNELTRGYRVTTTLAGEPELLVTTNR